MEQVVWNLLGNAVKFTPQQGRIDISLSEHDGQARLQVSDTGIGIAPGSLDSIFDLFSQALPAGASAGGRGAGLGIGLALVRDLVGAHGGRVQATSPGKDKGATFTVWLPLEATVAAAPAHQAPPSGFAGKRVLAVDDDAESVTALATILTMEGATVKTAFSAAQALQLLESEPFDLLLSDIGMPDMSGTELISRVRQLKLPARLHAIAMTGYGGNADIRRALAAGFDAHLTKPVSLEGLFAAVEGL
ncbi:hybrid sensor histidine kinase/response regulator [Tahibacter harae]|uniref:hybrid sensor histidine kinase/response regulator n=1 Tax=Tahibacter harae TaxID=2963937 RepID=UPI0034E0D631